MEDETLALTSFGASLSLSTTLRHSIQSEIAALDAASAALSKNIQNETAIHRGIAKEMERAKREMTELKRGGGDVVESNVVSGGIARGWREDVEKEMKGALNIFTAVSDDEGEEVRFLPKQKQVLRAKQEKISCLERELSHEFSTVANFDEETKRIQGDLERLNAQKSKVTGEMEKKRMEYEGEVRRNGRVKEAIGRSRGNSGGFARGIADKAQEQITERSSNISKEASLQSEVNAKQEEMTRLLTEEKKLDAELAVLSGLLDSFLQQHVEAEGEIKRSVGIKRDLEEEMQELDKMNKVKESKAEVERAAAQSLSEAKASYEAALAEAKELEAIKVGNDKTDANMLVPALTRKADASKEKEMLVSEVSELHKIMAEQQSKMNEAVSGTDAKAAKKSDELKDVKEKVEKAQNALGELIKLEAGEVETITRDIQETNDFSAHFEAATKGEIARLDTMKRQKTDERLAKLDQRRSELASLEDARREGIDHLRDALALFEQMKELEAVIKNADVELAEDGEELNPVSDEHVKMIADLKACIAEGTENSQHDESDHDRDDMVTQASPSAKRRVNQ